MTDKRIIKIRNLDYKDDGSEITEITTQGKFSGQEDNYLLEFEEIFAEDIKSKTFLRVKNGSCVNLLRQGDINSELIIERGKRHNCHYLTPYGDMMIGIHAKKISSKVTNGKGKLQMIYTVDFYGSVESTKEMTIEFR